MKEAITALLADWVRTPSVNPAFAGPRSGHGGERALVEKVADACRRIGLETSVLRDADPARPSVVGRLPGTGGGRSLMLNGHVDTVGIETYEGDPFAARVADGRLYGRGAYDMKGGLAACFAAIRAIAQRDRPLRGDVLISAVADEEEASLGAQAVARAFPTDGVVVAEPTELEPIVAHKGFAWIRVRTTGFACHGSLPGRGIDANRRMGPVLRAIDLLEADRAALRHPLLGAPSLHIGRIEGGLGPSLYSPACELMLELRTLPGEDPARLRKMLQARIEQATPSDSEGTTVGGTPAEGTTTGGTVVELALERPALEPDRDAHLASALAGVLQRHGLDDTLGGVPYWTDAGIFRRHAGEVVLFGPSGAGAHEDTEWVDLDSVATTAAVLRDLVTAFCR